jgi:hypothetical protein
VAHFLQARDLGVSVTFALKLDDIAQACAPDIAAAQTAREAPVRCVRSAAVPRITRVYDDHLFRMGWCIQIPACYAATDCSALIRAARALALRIGPIGPVTGPQPAIVPLSSEL